MLQRTLPEEIYIGYLKTIQFIGLFLKFKPVSLSKHWTLNLFITCSMQKQYLRSRFFKNYTFWPCANLWFAVTQKMLFSECTVVFSGRCNLLNSRQFCFIDQEETGVKSCKEQIKLTLFHDCKPSWIFNKDAVDISSVKVATMCELQHIPRASFFVERPITSRLQYIWFFSHWFDHSEKSQKLEAAFMFWQTKH